MPIGDCRIRVAACCAILQSAIGNPEREQSENILELKALTISSLRKRLASREVKAVDVCRTALDRIERLSELNAFLTVTGDAALAQAQQIDRAVENGEELPRLAGSIIA